MTKREDAQLRALVAAAWPHRGTPALREHVERIEFWNLVRAIADGQLEELHTEALVKLDAELRRRQMPVTV